MYSTKFVLSLVTLTACAILSSAVKMEITLYKNANFTGQSITVDQTHTNFGCASNIIEQGHGFSTICYLGSWAIMHPSQSGSLAPSTTRRCVPVGNTLPVTSVLRSGPADTSTQAIAFDRQKVIIVIEKTAEANLNITSQVLDGTSVYTYGRSNWTLYELNNFEGQSLCLISTTEILWRQAKDLGIPSIGSVIRGCAVKHTP